MKKIISLFLALLLCLSLFAACAEPVASDPTDDKVETDTPSDNPPSDNSPSDNSPSDNPPSDNPPSDNPPSDNPPSDNPTVNPENVVEVTPTDFEEKFSPENEILLNSILSSEIEIADVKNLLPSFSFSENKKLSAGDGGYTYVYESVSKQNYDDLCATLKLSGYAQYTENIFTGKAHNSDAAVNNYFATFLSSIAQIDVSLHEAAGRMYVNVTPRSASVLPQREASSYVKPDGNYPTIWTQYGLEDIGKYESSLGYIIRVADGSFVILNGGENLAGVEDRMLEILKKQAPDPDNIVISAWIFTHAQSDNVGAFLRFASKYANDESITLRQVVYSLPDNAHLNDGEAQKQDQFKTAVSKFKDTEILKVHTGNVLYYADLRINILYTQEDYLATLENQPNKKFGNYNTATLVTQFVTADGTKLLIGADHPVNGNYSGYTWCEGALYNWYGSFIESYVVSTFHHGLGGGADNVIYPVINPSLVLWCTDTFRIFHDENGKPYTSPITNHSFNKFFTNAKNDDPENDIRYYTAEGDSIIILQFADGAAIPTRYPSINDYLNPSKNEPNEKVDFDILFSKENEELLSNILASNIETGSVENILPALSKTHTKKLTAGDGGFLYVYEGASKALYNELCSALVKASYAKYTENVFNGNAIDSDAQVRNYFATLVSTKAQIDIGLHESVGRMYVSITPRLASVLPQREAPEYTTPEGDYPTIWTQYGLEDINNTDSSLGYIIRIADGSFIILDSGEHYDGIPDRIYEILKKQAPDPDNIVISAWILTHAHRDHVGGFINFAIKYASDKTITVKQIVYNFPDNSLLLNENDAIWQNKVFTAAEKFEGAEVLKAHTGNVLYYADVRINILYTQEDYLAVLNQKFGNYNTSSLVTQFVMADGTKLLIGADQPVSGNVKVEGVTYPLCEGALYNWYGSFIESYVVSTFHHGFGGGADNTIYKVINAPLVLWSIDAFRITKDSDGNLYNSRIDVDFNTYFTKADDMSGITYYTPKNSSILILHFVNGKAITTLYQTYDTYKAS